MRYVILALLILLAAQPAQASFCSTDMGMGDTTPVMDHAMPQTPDTNCCDHEDQDSSQSCDPLAYCGAVPAGAAVLAAGLDFVPVLIAARLPSFNNGPLIPSFDSPLYRPPIS